MNKPASAGLKNISMQESIMEFLNSIKDLIPDYAKDIRLNLDGTIARSSLQG